MHRLNTGKPLDEGASLVLADIATAIALEGERLAALGEKIRRTITP